MLLGTPMGNGTKRIHVSRDGDQWRTEEKWSSKKICPYYNDLVVYQDHLYGFDTGKLVCVSLNDGKEAWHARGYGNGQVLLLADQGLLLVLTEEGEVALLRATAEKRDELCRFKGDRRQDVEPSGNRARKAVCPRWRGDRVLQALGPI